MKMLRTKDGRFVSLRRVVLTVIFWAVVVSGTAYALSEGLVMAVHWSNTHGIQKPIVLLIGKEANGYNGSVFSVVPRQVIFDIKPTILTIFAVSKVETRQELDAYYASLNAVQRKICDTFGIYDCKHALAIQSCENGKQNPEITNVNTNGSIDVGLMQINDINWNKNGCGGLHELTTIDGNLKCAYIIWDRGDGVQGDGRGTFQRWSTENGECVNSRM